MQHNPSRSSHLSKTNHSEDSAHRAILPLKAAQTYLCGLKMTNVCLDGVGALALDACGHIRGPKRRMSSPKLFGASCDESQRGFLCLTSKIRV